MITGAGPYDEKSLNRGQSSMYLPQNILKREMLWMLHPPRGIVGIQRQVFINVD